MPQDIVRESEKANYRGLLTSEVPVENLRTPLNLFEQFSNQISEPINRLHYDVRGSQFQIDLKTHRKCDRAENSSSLHHYNN